MFRTKFGIAKKILTLFKWAFLSFLVAILAGTSSAAFLLGLHYVGDFRDAHVWIISLMPLGGLAVGLSYYYLGSTVEKGNNQLINEFHTPQKPVPFRMAPLVAIGTLLTHLVGGSAGREGTAVQMATSLSDQAGRFFTKDHDDRKTLLICGVSAGFASVFGTPLAGAVFALEVFIIGRMSYEFILPAFLSAIMADHISRLALSFFQYQHTHYMIQEIAPLTFFNIFLAVTAGSIFGITAQFFSRTSHFFGQLFKEKISYAPLRPFFGGLILVFAYWALDDNRYAGLGISYIEEAFVIPSQPWEFLLKLVLTGLTLGAGFKGGEVTPLFYVGAALGSALSLLLPLPIGLLAGMGFVSVFSAATNTPLAGLLMGIELFGIEAGIYLALAEITAYLASGHKGIYSSQLIGTPKQKKP